MSNSITITIESAPEPTIGITVSPSSHTLDEQTASEEVSLTMTVNFSGLDTSVDAVLTVGEDTINHEFTSEEIAAGKFVETYDFLCDGDEPGAKTIAVKGTGLNSQPVIATTTFTVIADQAKKKN